MTDEMAQLLKTQRLKRIAEILDQELTTATNDSLSYQEFFVRLLRAQWHYQQESALAWRIERARMPEKWTLESFPFKKQPGVSQKQIRSFAELDFVPKAENLVLIGPTGVDEKPKSTGGLHAEQHYEYHLPVHPGDVLTAETKPGNTWERESKRAGKLTFRERVTEYRNQRGELVVTARGVGVTTERPVDQG